jgi:DNA polymerase III alpha subunit
MKVDNFGQFILTETDVCELYLRDPARAASQILVEHALNISDELEIERTPRLVEYVETDETVEQFDRRMQGNWHMPEEYKTLDVAKYVLDLCETDAQRQRVGEELLMYLDRDLFPLLQYLKHLVDTMRKHNIVWGVGRGSSTSSYVLFLLGVHKIDSLYFDLDIKEFLR